jgi:hypothetical protein
MLISESESSKFSEWLNSHQFSAHCPSCNSDAGWELGDKFVYGRVSPQEFDTLNHLTSFPMLYTICNNCGFVRFYSCEKVGVVPSPFVSGEGFRIREQNQNKK